MNRECDKQELMDLLDAVCQDTLDEKGWERLEEILLADRDARALYRRYVNSHIGLKQYLGARADAPPAKPAKSPVLTQLGSGIQQVVDFCWRATPFSILVAVGLPLACVLLLVVALRRPEVAEVDTAVPAPARVAALRRTVDCRWTDEAPMPNLGESFATGRQIELVSGLAEITTVSGATVILEGPAMLRFESGRHVGLRAGKLTAQVPQQARGFTVETPNVSVIDFGTEFGVCVEEKKGGAEIEVFRGEVELRAAKQSKKTSTVRQRLVAGRAVRVELIGLNGQAIVRDIAPSADRFVRQLPVSAKVPEPVPDLKRSGPAIVADFSGGNGVSKVDQFPGIPGAGWATKWELREVAEVESIASVEETYPVLGGGDYLRVLATRRSGAGHVRRSVSRRVDVAGLVDIKKPHVISFNIRVDALNLFEDPRDTITLCNNSKSDDKLDDSPSAGWHVRVYGTGSDAAARRWRFCDGDGTGRARVVDSGIVVRQGSTYSFRILVNPEARRWTPSVAVDGGRYRGFRAMGMRSSGTAQKRGYWPFLHFRWEMQGGNRGADRKRIGFSVDSIRVVPADKASTADSGDPGLPASTVL